MTSSSSADAGPPSSSSPASEAPPTASDTVKAEPEEEGNNMDKPADDSMVVDEDSSSNQPATVFSIRLKQPRSNLLHKMSVPELCRNFRYFYSFAASIWAFGLVFVCLSSWKLSESLI